MTGEYPIVNAAVALAMDESAQKFLWLWNAKWSSFSLPTSKIRPWDGKHTNTNFAVTREAGERAAAEAFGVPVVLNHVLQLRPILERSGRDGRLKSYVYDAFRASPHDKFKDNQCIPTPHLWLAGYEVLSREFRPLAESSVKVMEQLAEHELVPGRRQMASTVLLSRPIGGSMEFLMHWNPEWGYSFPSKRRQDGESAQHAAHRVLEEELGLKPGVTVTLTPTRDTPTTLSDYSESEKTSTFYMHFMFTAILHDGARLNSKEKLVWVSLADILVGKTEHPKTPDGKTEAAGKISKNAHNMLEYAGYC